MSTKEIIEAMDLYQYEIIRLRRLFHHYPEAGWTEFLTTARIAEYLDKYDIPYLMGKDVINTDYVFGRPSVKEIEEHLKRAYKDGGDDLKKYIDKEEGYPGLMALIDSGKAGPTVALRFDIDCNDRIETVSVDHIPNIEGFASVYHGCQHACGHDGHTAVGLLCARILNDHRDSFTGKVKILFQPAEEGVRGAKAMAEKGLVDDVDYLFTGHFGFDALDIETMYVGTDISLATTKIDAVFTGTGAHPASAPQKGHNALLAAASAMFAMQTCDHDGRGTAVVNVGVLNAGSGRNIIPDHALMKLETRGSSTEINDELSKKVVDMLEASARMYGCKVDISYVGQASTSKSDPELQEYIGDIAGKYGIYSDIRGEYTLQASEDAAILMSRVKERGGKACYSFWGTPLKAPHHNECFDIDEKCLIKAAKLVVASVLDL